MTFGRPDSINSLTQSAPSSKQMSSITAYKSTLPVGIKPYEPSRRKRDDRKKGEVQQMMEIDHNISMFSNKNDSVKIIKPSTYVPEVKTKKKAQSSSRTSAISGLFRKTPVKR